MSPPARASALPADTKLVGVRSGSDPLAARAARRDRKAFEQIYERHHQELYRYCLSIVRRREDAEDALQATMAAALRALPGEQRHVALRPWLYRIAHNESISLLRQRRPMADAEQLIDPVAAPADERIAERDRLRRLVADLRSLPERQSSAIVMRELSGLSYEEIGEALSSSEAAARQTVYEARVALRELEEGRAMECEEVRRTISDRDGRKLRGRKIRTHIDNCDGCFGFAASIERRKADLGALCPPIPAVAATAMLSGLLGGGAGATVTAGGGAVAAGGVAGAGVAGPVAVKGASVLAAVVLAAGAAEVGGVIDLPLPAGLGGANSDPGSSGSLGSEAGSPAGPAAGTDGSNPAGSRDGANGKSHRHGQPAGAPAGAGGSSGLGIAANGDAGSTPGQSAGAPGHSGATVGEGAPEVPGGSPVTEAPGQPGDSPVTEAPGGAGGPPVTTDPATGGGTSSPAEPGPAPEAGEPAAPGNSGSTPGETGSSSGKSELAPGHTGATGGNSASAPGHTGATPGSSGSAPGRTGEAPGHSKGDGVLGDTVSGLSQDIGTS